MSKNLNDKHIRATNPCLCLDEITKRFADDPLGRQRAHYHFLKCLLDEGGHPRRLPPLGLVKNQCSTIEPNNERVGVVGLAVDHKKKVGLVTPLTAKPHNEWGAANNLPFNGNRIEQLLDDLLDAYLEEWSLPEVYAFHFSDTLRHGLEGMSMNFAALLAVIDQVNDQPAVFNFSSAVIASEIDGSLSSVGSVSLKLDAFVREYGNRGTLLVRCADDDVAKKYDEYFDQVWPVNTLAELAAKLEVAGLLDPFIGKQQLDHSRLAAIKSRVEKVKYIDSRKAMRIIQATEQSIDREDSYASLVLLRLLEDQHRHLGDFQESIRYHHKVEVHLQCHREIDCYDHQLMAASSFASSLYDAHQFEQGVAALVPWIDRIEKDPLVCDPRHRVYLWNTYGRLLIITGAENWRRYFNQALQLQQQVEPSSAYRTRNYEIYGLLKQNECQAATELIEQNTEERLLDSLSKRYLNFYRAERDRRVGQITSGCDGIAEQMQTRLNDNRERSPDYVDGFYLQALARQADRIQSETAELMALAGEIFVSEARGQQENIINLFAQCCMFAEACFRDDPQSIEDAGASILQYLKQYPAYEQHYKDQVDRCVAEPCSENIDALFERTPYM